MRRSLALVFCILALNSFRAPAQQSLSDEEKKRLFLKAREEMTTIPWTPPAATEAPKPKPKAKPQPERDDSPPVKPFTPRQQDEPPTPRIDPTPPPVVRLPPTPAPRPNPIIELPPQESQFRVEKSGVGRVDEEPEPPKEEKRGFWSRIFGGGSSSVSTGRYVTGSVKRAITGAPVRNGRWRYIVVHNSGTRQGSAKAFEHYHRRVRGMSNGMAYHFVIGNGTSTGNGQIEIGNRWSRQIQGGHVHSDYLNNISVGVCLVGDFNNSRPKPQQLASLEELVKAVRSRVGRVNGQHAVVAPHRNINPPRWPTDCPGDEFPYSWLRKF